MKIIPYSRQHIDDKDIKAAAKVLRSDWISPGPNVAGFEEAIARYCGVRYAVVTSSGTAALHIACLAAGLSKEDEAITSPITFLATANSILYTQAKPVFADIDYETININPEQIQKKITRKTKAVLPVHFAGLPCDMEKIYAVSKKNRLIVIEDACHALGAEYKYGGRWFKVGSCRHSDMAVFSFQPLKHITTGEGGAITTNNKRIYKKMLALRSHGIYKTRAMSKKQGPWYYEMRDLGFNYRLTDFQCALGFSQLKKIGSFIKKRRKIANIYNKEFRGFDGIKIPAATDSQRHAYHLYVLRIDFARFRINRKKFMSKLREHGIMTQVHYIPLYQQPYYKKRHFIDARGFPASEQYYKEAISIPLYPDMANSDINRVIYAVKKILNE